MADTLKGDPDIHVAAVAGLSGHGDFMALLALPRDQWQIAVAVVTEQQRIIRQQQGGG